MSYTPTPDKVLEVGDVCRLRNSPLTAPTPDGSGGEHYLWLQIRTMRVSKIGSDQVTCEWMQADGATFTTHVYPRSVLYHVSFYEQLIQGKSNWWVSNEDGEYRTYDTPDWTPEQIAIANGRLAQIAATMQAVMPPDMLDPNLPDEAPPSQQPDTVQLPPNL